MNPTIDIGTTHMAPRVTSPAPRSAWRDVAAADPGLLATQTPEWVDAICRFGPYEDASRLYEFDDDHMVVLPLVRRTHGAGRLAVESSFPLACGIGGLLGSRPPDASHICAIVDDLRQRPVWRISIRPDPLQDPGWAAATRAGVEKKRLLSHVLDLRAGFDEVAAKRFSKLTRRNIRKAQRADLEITKDCTGELLAEYFDLYEQSVARWAEQSGEPLWLARWRSRRKDSLKKLRTIATSMPDGVFRLWAAHIEGMPAAIIIVLQGTNALYARGAMDRELAGPTRAYDLLHRLAIEEACDAGCSYYHMGETCGSESLARYKERFGAEALLHHEYRFERVPLTRIELGVRAVGRRLGKLRSGRLL